MDPMIALVILLLIAVNAFYVAAEFAAVSVRRSKVRQMAEEGHPLARRLMPILSDPAALDRFVAACQIGITISSLVLGAYGQARLANTLLPFFSSLGVMDTTAAASTSAVVILIGLTIFQMVMGELVPKSLALQFPTPIALLTAIPMRWSMQILRWFIWVLNGSGNRILSWFGISEISHQHIHSAEEINLLIAESRDGGLLEPDEHRRLTQALQLGVRSVAEIMVPRTRIQAMDVQSPLEEVVRTFSEKPFTRLPVYETSLDNIVGIVHAREVALHALSSGSAFSLRDIVRPVLVVFESTTAGELLQKMRAERRQMAVVIDEHGGTMGLVGVSDILDEFLGDVTERSSRLGDIQPARLSDGRVRIPASLRLDEAAEWIGRRWEGESITVSGKIVESVGYLPAPGETIWVDGIRVEIERATRRTIKSVLITPPANLSQQEED